jgi:hypothetical protein
MALATQRTQRVIVIARHAALEAWRARLALALFAALVLAAGCALFVAELAVIEGARARLAWYAALSRLAAVCLVAAHVLAGVTREFDDKCMDMFLALDLPRGHYILGKLAGFALIALFAAFAAALPLWSFAAPAAVLQWWLALALELTLIAAFALFCATAFAQFTPAAALVFAFYALARALGALQLMSAHPVSGAGSLSHSVMHGMVQILTWVMPALDRWPHTGWLLGEAPGWMRFAEYAGQGAIYIALITTAAMVDFARREL